MKLKKLLSITMMILVCMVTFSSCLVYIDEGRAIERIDAIKPDKALNFTVVMETSIVTNVDGERMEFDLAFKAGQYYDVKKTESSIAGVDGFYLYNDWLYYGYYYTCNENASFWNKKASIAFMRINVYTGETENLYDFGIQIGFP